MIDADAPDDVFANKDWLNLFSEFVSYLRIHSKEQSLSGVKPDADGYVPLELYNSQRMYMREVAEGLKRGQRHIVCLKNRQAGITTVSLAIDVFWTAMWPGTQGVIVCDTDSNRMNFRGLIRDYVESFPKKFFGSSFGIKKGSDNKETIGFTNGSKLDLLVAGKRINKTLGEGRGYNFAHLTECANYGSAEGLRSFIETLAHEHPNRLYLFESPLALDTPIPTPAGWKTLGAIKEGQFVLNEKGKPCCVIGVSPTFINRKCFRIMFKNGDSIVADASHKWSVEERRYPRNQQWKTVEVRTDQLDPYKHFLPVPEPLDLPELWLPIDPYLLGVWLGDGATAEPRITAGDEDIDDMQQLLQERGCKLGVLTKSKDRAGMFHVLGVRKTFINLGLLGNKHIPRQYLRASEEQRRLLLAGLMDTDGHVNKKTFSCTFASINERLIDDVSELLTSLGIRFRKSINAEAGKLRRFPGGNVSVCQRSWRLVFSEFPERLVFKLPRKRRIHETSTRASIWRKFKQVGIESIVEVPSVPVRCIAVDTPSHLFLAGRTMLPTHNTAKGFNHWRDMCDEAQRDKFTKRFFFIGWWAKELNAISLKGPAPQPQLYREYGLYPPTPEETEKMALVLKKHNHAITQEQLAWYRWRAADQAGTVADLHQNQPWTADEAFVMSGYSFFPIRELVKWQEAITNYDNGPGERPGVRYRGYRFFLGERFVDSKMEQVFTTDQVELRVWEEPDPHGTYVIGCDPAMGRNEKRDRHGISIWRCYADKLEQVAEYAHNNVDTRQCAWILAYLAGAYRSTCLNIEVQGGWGMAVLAELKTVRQLINSEVYADSVRDLEWEDFLAQARFFIYRKYDSMNQAGNVIHFKTHQSIKFEVMNQFRDSLAKGALIIRSIPLLNEMREIQQTNNEIAAPDPLKDDRVFAAVLANRTWIDMVQPSMIAMNATYDRVWAGALAEETQVEGFANKIVENFFKKKEELALNADPVPKWMRDRGFA